MDNICKSSRTKRTFLSFGLMIAWVSVIAVIFLLSLLGLNKIFGVVVDRDVLVPVIIVLELYILFKTAMKDIPQIFSIDDVNDITCNYTLRSYSTKLVSVFKGVIKSQIFLVVPFFVSYAIIRSADLMFYFNCIVAIISIGAITSIWALLVYGAVSIFRRHSTKFSRTKEILLISAFLITSIIGVMTSKGVSFESLLFNIMDIFKQAIFLFQTFAFSINSHIIFMVNIVALFLVARGIVALIFHFVRINSYDFDLVVTKPKYIVANNPLKIENCILRSCLARSPTE